MGVAFREAGQQRCFCPSRDPPPEDTYRVHTNVSIPNVTIALARG